jgi:hypothetical protein
MIRNAGAAAGATAMTDANVEEIDPFLAMLRSIQLGERADYLSRGRRLRNLTTEELERRWIELMREWSNDFGGFVYTACHRLGGARRSSMQSSPLKAVLVKRSAGDEQPVDSGDPAGARADLGSRPMWGSRVHHRREWASADQGVIRQSIPRRVPHSRIAEPIRARIAEGGGNPCGEQRPRSRSLKGSLVGAADRWRACIRAAPIADA